MAQKTEFKTWDQYTQEAKIEPFQIPTKDETITIEAPSGTAMIRVAQGLRSGDLELIAVAITGDQWERVEDLLSGASHKAFAALLEDMLDHFELYEPVTLVGPGGSKLTRKRPTEIARLINQGYRPVGEAPASS